MNQVRNLKVGYTSRPKTKYVNNYPKTVFTQVPNLQLCGNWFEEAGFSVGDDVTIIVRNNKIEILGCTYKIAPPRTEAPEQLDFNVIGDFVSYIDNLHYEGYSKRMRENYPDQWEELLRQFETDYSLHA